MEFKLWDRLPPGARRALVWAGAGTVIVLTVLSAGSPVREDRNRERDLVKNVFSDINTREVGVDSLAASVDLLRQREEALRGELRDIRHEMELIRKNAGILGAAQDPEKADARLKELEDIISEFRVIKSLLPKRLREMRKEEGAPASGDTGPGLPDSGTAGSGSSAGCYGENCPGGSPASGSISGDSEPDQEGEQVPDIREEFVFEEIPPAEPARFSRAAPAPEPRPRRQIRRISGGEAGGGPRNRKGDTGRGAAVSRDSPSQKSSGSRSGKSAGGRQVYLPSGTIMSGYLITGIDAPTRDEARGDPFPVLINLDRTAILPGDGQYDLSGCFVLAAGFGDLSSERVYFRTEKLSCMGPSGRVAEQKLNAYISGEDGKAGLRGRLVSKQGRLIARSLTAGFLEGLSGAFDVNPVPVISTTGSNATQYQSVYSRDALRGAAVSGAGKALERVADFYLRLADSMFPVLEVDAARRIDIVVTEGVSLEFDFRGREGRQDGFYADNTKGSQG